jgi:energy-coupling factor transporter transmembrane protein EcfT
MLSDLSPKKSNTMMSLVEQELLVFPTFTPAVSNVQSLVFCSIFGCSLFAFFVFWPLHYRFLFNLQLLMSPFISSNVFLQSPWHYFNWKLLKHSDVDVRGVNIGLCKPKKWQPSPLKPLIHPYVQCPFCLSHILLVHVIQW